MLKNLKMLIGIENDDTSLDEKLNLIISNVSKRLKVLLGGIEPPADLEYIIVEVAVKRFNRIGSEGLGSHSVEGESMNFTDDDFREFAGEIQAYLDSQKESTRGKVRFL